MRQQTITKTDTGASSALIMDTYISPFNVGFGAVVTGTATYTVQHTFQNPNDGSVTATWFDHPVVDDLTVNADGNYAFPVAAIRLNITAVSGSVVLTVIQAGLVGG